MPCLLASTNVFLILSQGREARLQELQEERQRKREEQLAKEEAAQERRKAIEAERQVKEIIVVTFKACRKNWEGLVDSVVYIKVYGAVKCMYFHPTMNVDMPNVKALAVTHTCNISCNFMYTVTILHLPL